MNRTKAALLPLSGLIVLAVACDAGPKEPPSATPDPAAKSTGGVDQAKMQAIEKARVKAKDGLKAQKVGGINAKSLARPAPKGLPAPKDVAAPPSDATTTKTGLATKVLTKGKGTKKPGDHDKVKVHYTGWTKDGKMFDSSVMRGQPASFPVRGVIPGWTEALKLMVAGEKRRLWIPGKLAYGDRPRMGAPSGQLTFDVELLEVIEAPKPPETPSDVAGPPAGAKKTKSGLAYRILSRGKGAKHPKATDRVRVHYSGWTKDGKMFDSSVMRGQPATFGLNQVIKGWTEGVQLMKEGDKARFWIPAELAYGAKPKRPGAPSGQLTFDIELIKIF